MHPLAAKYQQIKEPKNPHDWEMFKSGRYPEYRCGLCGKDSRDVSDDSECEGDVLIWLQGRG